ncbi:MAG: hypothetical protein K6D57_01370 [Paludibacteraceae bacterium]|nr:hypothetical protein [Paludibacteraceae bacterium]
MKHDILARRQHDLLLHSCKYRQTAKGKYKSTEKTIAGSTSFEVVAKEKVYFSIVLFSPWQSPNKFDFAHLA